MPRQAGYLAGRGEYQVSVGLRVDVHGGVRLVEFLQALDEERLVLEIGRGKRDLQNAFGPLVDGREGRAFLVGADGRGLEHDLLKSSNSEYVSCWHLFDSIHVGPHHKIEARD